jgi:beta-glucosidase
MIKIKLLIIAFILIIGSYFAYTQNHSEKNSKIALYKDTSKPLEQRISDALSRMTLEEKIRMCFGGEDYGKVELPGVPRLGIPTMYSRDGPRTAEGQFPATVFPCGIGEAAAWDLDLMKQSAIVLGQEARAQGNTMLLAPAINILRDPLDGRFFEYYTEDPYLNGELASAFIEGLQSQKVSACIKHFVCNEREWNRNLYMSNVDERTLREIYLRGFEMAVKKSNPWGLMTASNGLNGELCSDNKWLLTDVLENEWGYKGLIRTDGCHSRSTVKAALAGLDMDMPWGNFETDHFGKPLMEAVQEGIVPMSTLDEMVRRILRTHYEVGLMDGIKATDGGSINTKEHQKIELKYAQESLVLLKNKHNLLPLDINKIHKVVILGPNADKKFCIAGYGGSSGGQAPFEITPLKGLQNKLSKTAEVNYIPLINSDFKIIGQENWKSNDDGKKGIEVNYYSTSSSNLILKETESAINFNWFNKSPIPNKIKSGLTRIVCEGWLIAPESGTFTLRLTSDNNAVLWFNDKGAAAIRNTEQGVNQFNTALVQLKKGKEYFVRLTYSQPAGGQKNINGMNYWNKNNPSVRLEWAYPSDSTMIARSVKPFINQIKSADAVIFVGGLDNNLDSEGRDRKNMDFPEDQEILIKQVSKINPNTIVVLMQGSPTTMKWINNVPSVLEAFYPGMEGGTAIAQAIFGDINPSGKLSFSWPKKLEDSPAYALGTQDLNNVNFTEGIYIGYRYYDTKNVAPLFPFGFGLSYTNYRYSDLKVNKIGRQVQLTFKITNTGKRGGAEISQIYVSEPKCSVDRPQKELKSFARTYIAPGETKTINIKLGPNAFSYYSVKRKSWIIDPGIFNILIGASSSDIRLTSTLYYEK